MKPLSRKTILFSCFCIDFFISIHFISNNWISNRREVYANLMSSPCHQIHLKKCIFSGNNSLVAKFCFSKFWVYWIKSGHLFTIIGVPANKWFNISFLIFHNSNNKRKIRLMNRSFCNLELKCMHCPIIFCYNNQSARILIETMNNSWAFNSVDNRWIEFWIFTSDTKTLKVI